MKYCVECGKKIKDKAVICVSCGCRIKGERVKSRGVAVFLAIILSYWSWLYTYKKDSWKFWVGLVLSFLGMFLGFIPALFVWFWAIIDTIVKDKDFYENY